VLTVGYCFVYFAFSSGHAVCLCHRLSLAQMAAKQMPKR
jgi:hypothetical protein